MESRKCPSEVLTLPCYVHCLFGNIVLMYGTYLLIVNLLDRNQNLLSTTCPEHIRGM